MEPVPAALIPKPGQRPILLSFCRGIRSMRAKIGSLAFVLYPSAKLSCIQMVCIDYTNYACGWQEEIFRPGIRKSFARKGPLPLGYRLSG